MMRHIADSIFGTPSSVGNKGDIASFMSFVVFELKKIKNPKKTYIYVVEDSKDATSP